MRGAAQLDAGEPDVEREARPTRAVVIDAERRVDHTALGLHGKIGRQIEAGEREVHVADDHRRARLDGREPHLARPHRELCAGHPRARGRDPRRRVAGARYITGLERDAVDLPALDGSEPRVLERDRPAVEGEAFHRDGAVGARAKILARQPDRRRVQEGTVLPRPAQLDAAQMHLDVGAAAGRRVMVERDRDVEGAARHVDRTAGRQRERRQPDVDVAPRERAADLHRSQAHVVERERERRAGDASVQRDGARGPRGHGRRVARLQRDAVHTPGARRCGGLVLDGDDAVPDVEVVDRHGEPAAAAARLEKIGDIELLRADADDAERRCLQRPPEDSQMTEQQGAAAEPDVQPVEAGERCRVAIEHAEVPQGDAAAQQ